MRASNHVPDSAPHKYRGLHPNTSLDECCVVHNSKIGRQCPSRVCAVTRRRFPVGASPTRQTLQPEATGAAMEVTKWLKPSDNVSRYTVTARVCRP
jgi:hypothetical protein